MANPQHAILTNLEKYQWYTHLSRTEGADLGVIKKAIKEARAAGSETGVTVPINVCILFGPTLLADLTTTCPTTSRRTRATSRPTARSPRARRRSCCSG